MIPEDKMMLLSYVNMKLRDEYDSFTQLCEELELDMQEIAEKLQEIGYEYDAETNRFR